MIQLHHYPGNASLIPHILLHEMELPFELVLVDRAQNAHKSPDYLRLNPNGQIPTVVLREGGQPDLVLYETAAICLHLSDTHPCPFPGARHFPAAGTPERAHAYKWLFWMANTLQPALMMYFYPERYVLADGLVGGVGGGAACVAGAKATAQQRIGPMLQQLDQQLAASAAAGDWFLGEKHSILDTYAWVLCRWTRGFSGDSTPPARTWPHIGPWQQRMLARPALQRACAAEGLQAPLI